MVLSDLSKNSEATVCESHFELESGQCIKYVAPALAIIRNDSDRTGDRISGLRRKNSGANGSDPRDDWESVYELCRAVDYALRFESDDLVRNRNVLEIGFCTALPSVLAHANGATHITMHSFDSELLEKCAKLTVAKNKVKVGQSKFIDGDWENLQKSTKEKEFDLIFGIEVFNVENTKFEQIHDIIDYALADDGICLLETRMYYYNCDGSLPEFLDLVKSRGKFDIYERWSSPKSEIVQRKVIQLTRAIR